MDVRARYWDAGDGFGCRWVVTADGVPVYGGRAGWPDGVRKRALSVARRGWRGGEPDGVVEPPTDAVVLESLSRDSITWARWLALSGAGFWDRIVDTFSARGELTPGQADEAAKMVGNGTRPVLDAARAVLIPMTAANLARLSEDVGDEGLPARYAAGLSESDRERVLRAKAPEDWAMCRMRGLGCDWLGGRYAMVLDEDGASHELPRKDSLDDSIALWDADATERLEPACLMCSPVDGVVEMVFANGRRASIAVLATIRETYPDAVWYGVPGKPFEVLVARVGDRMVGAAMPRVYAERRGREGPGYLDYRTGGSEPWPY